MSRCRICLIAQLGKQASARSGSRATPSAASPGPAAKVSFEEYLAGLGDTTWVEWVDGEVEIAIVDPAFSLPPPAPFAV